MKSRTFIFSVLLITGVASTLIWIITDDYSERKETVVSAPVTEAVMYKNAGCQCCNKWASYMEGYGYDISVRPVSNMPAIKDKYHVPGNIESCHTVIIGDYIVEGHVPIEDINRLRDEKPNAIGIAAPGMPASAPGMNTSFNDPYDVYIINQQGNSRVFASH